jgi:precorrin-6B methylase 2
MTPDDLRLEAGLLLDVMEHDRNAFGYIMYRLGFVDRTVLRARNGSTNFELQRTKAIVHYNDKQVLFNYNRSIQFTINEIFVDGEYEALGVKGRTVIDIGTGLGDTPIYFSIKGAKRVYGYETDRKQYEAARANIALNGIKNITLYNRAYNDSDLTIRADVLKMDCEGCEYEFFEKYEGKLKSFKEIIIEYHNGEGAISERLKRLGFSIHVKKDKKYSGFGILYARKTSIGKS